MLIVNYPRPRVVRAVRLDLAYRAWGRGRLARGIDTTIVETTIVETTIVETTRPRVVRAARLDLAYRAWGRGRLARGIDTTIVETTIVETTRPRVVRAERPFDHTMQSPRRRDGIPYRLSNSRN